MGFVINENSGGCCNHTECSGNDEEIIGFQSQPPRPSGVESKHRGDHRQGHAYGENDLDRGRVGRSTDMKFILAGLFEGG